MRNGLQVVSVELKRGMLDLRGEIVGKLAAEFSFDDHLCFEVRHAEKTLEHLIRGNRIAMKRQYVCVRAARDDLAVDQDAIAVENDEIEGHEDQDFSSSSG